MSNPADAIGNNATFDPASALSWFTRLAWLGIAANFALGLAGIIYPEFVLRFLDLEPAVPLVWPRFAAFLLILLSVFYIPGATDPIGQRFAAVFSVVCRLVAVGFFGIVGGGYVIFGLYDLAFGLPQAILLYRARPLLR